MTCFRASTLTPTAHALQDDVIIEPIIQNLGLGDAELEQRIQEQMAALHEFFKRLYDQDQEEIRCVFAAPVCYGRGRLTM